MAYAFKDFRGWLDYLEKKGKLVRVKKEVNPEFGVSAGIRKASDIDGPALLFENVKGYPGWRVAGGLFATQKLSAVAYGLPLAASEDGFLQRHLKCDEKYIKPKLVSTGPCKEVIIKGNDVDLYKMPFFKISGKDEGVRIEAGVEITKDPETGIRNVGLHRRLRISKNKTGMVAGKWQHLRQHILKTEALGRPCEVVTAIGSGPWMQIASQVKAPYGVDETYIAGAFKGAPIEMVKCETVDLEVPADSEVVIEGVTVPGETVLDGPFGEFPGNYITITGGLGIRAPVIKVTAITMRKDPIMQIALLGVPMTENHWMKKWALSAEAYRAASRVAIVKGLNMTVGGCAGYHAVVAIDKRDEAEPIDVMHAIFATRASVKLVVVVDADDIDIYDANDVEYAIATRMHAEHDVHIMPSVPFYEGEGLSFSGRQRNRWGIDATMPLKDREWYKKIVIPGVEEVDYI